MMLSQKNHLSVPVGMESCMGGAKCSSHAQPRPGTSIRSCGPTPCPWGTSYQCHLHFSLLSAGEHLAVVLSLGGWVPMGQRTNLTTHGVSKGNTSCSAHPRTAPTPEPAPSEGWGMHGWDQGHGETLMPCQPKDGTD